MKVCTKCKEVKELSSYSRKTSSKDGLRSCCKICDKVSADSRRDVIRAYSKSRVELRRRLYWADIEKSREYKRAYKLRNASKIAQANKLWALNNKEKKSANRMRYNANKRQSQPTALSKDQVSEIWTIYKVASYLTNATGVKYHVDHIIPLQGKIVCGLHVPWNLQILTTKDNLSKSNKINGDYCGRK